MKRESRVEKIPMSRALMLLGIGGSTHKACLEKGTLPTPIKISARTDGYYSHELEALIAACNSGADADGMRAIVKQIHEERRVALAQNFKRFAV